MSDRLAPVRMQVDRNCIQAYARLSKDFNPIHVDPDYAARTPFGGVIAHGALSLNLIWRWIEQAFGASGAQPHITETRFCAPVRENDLVEACGAPADDGTYRVWVRNQDDVVVIEGVLSLSARPSDADCGATG